MEGVTSEAVREFLKRLGERYPHPGVVYLLGGGALCLLGSPRETRDIDYTTELPTGTAEEFNSAVKQLAREMQPDLEPVPLSEFWRGGAFGQNKNPCCFVPNAV